MIKSQKIGARLGFAMLGAGMLLGATPVLAQTGNPGMDSPGDALSRNLRSLAENPKSVHALMGAGKAALELGDPQAAITFFGRAEEQAPRDGRIKMWLGASLIQLQQPQGALKFFGEAVNMGAPEAEVAGARGLAYDLLGDPRRAQRDYRLALGGKPDAEVSRRLALSLAISGEREAALQALEGQLLIRDRAAERTKVFVLALTGDSAGATRAVQTSMPAQSAAMTPFLQRLPALSASERALAVHLGHFPSHARNLPVPVPAPNTYAAYTPSTTTGAGAPDARQPALGSRSGGRTRAAQRQVAVTPPPAKAPASQPQRVASAATAEQMPQSDSGRRAQRSSGRNSLNPQLAFREAAPARRAEAAPPKAAPRPVQQQVAATLQAATPMPAPSQQQVAAAAPARRTLDEQIASLSPPPAAQPQQIAGSTTPPGFQPQQVARVATPPAAQPQQIAGSTMPPGFQPQQVARVATPPAAQPQQIARVMTPPAAQPQQTTSVPTAAPAQQQLPASVPAPPASRPVQTAEVAPSLAQAMPGFSIAAMQPSGQQQPTSEMASVAEAPPPAAGVGEESGASRLAGIASLIAALPQSAPAEEMKPVPEPARPAPAPAAKPAPKPVTPATAAATKEPPAKVAAKKETPAPAIKPTAAAAKKEASAAAAKKEAPAAAAAKKPAAPAEPARIWVQVAGGADKAALPREYTRLKTKAPKLLAARAAWTTPLKATNRLLVGPFKTDKEAQAFVNELGKLSLSGFAWTSDAGQKIEKLAAQ